MTEYYSTSQEPQQAPLEFDPRYVQENIPYYASAYNRFQAEGTYGFNWSAAFFTGWWFIYRKVYLIGILFLILNYIPALGLLVNIFAGFMGNKFYFDQMREDLARGDYTNAGVNKWVYYAAAAVVIFIVLSACAGMAMFFPLMLFARA